ncbi:hypothetical protein BHE74_00039039 [Ensete ventricosum]|nr:hypothetical protein BHE74_00039039 [Ensete ventricosum]
MVDASANKGLDGDPITRKRGGRPRSGPLQGQPAVASHSQAPIGATVSGQGRQQGLSLAANPQGVGAHRGDACGHIQHAPAREVLASTTLAGAIA